SHKPCTRWCSLKPNPFYKRNNCQTRNPPTARFWSAWRRVRYAGPTFTLSMLNYRTRNFPWCPGMKLSDASSQPDRIRLDLRLAIASEYRGWAARAASVCIAKTEWKTFATGLNSPVTHETEGIRNSPQRMNDSVCRFRTSTLTPRPRLFFVRG